VKLTLIAVGRLKTASWVAAQTDYLERIRHYAPLNVVEIKDRIGQGLEEKAVVEKEGGDILRAAENVPALIALTPEGKLLKSPEWAETLQKLSETYQRLAFVIGGPNGLSEDVLKKSRLQLSLSPMTFPHELARVIFLEQLYRAFTILGGEKYHKG
jgi:23S rRNA (pseudouridine1915-N3)-methyltransferase